MKKMIQKGIAMTIEITFEEQACNLVDWDSPDWADQLETVRDADRLAAERFQIRLEREDRWAAQAARDAETDCPDHGPAGCSHGSADFAQS